MVNMANSQAKHRHGVISSRLTYSRISATPRSCAVTPGLISIMGMVWAVAGDFWALASDKLVAVLRGDPGRDEVEVEDGAFLVGVSF